MSEQARKGSLTGTVPTVDKVESTKVRQSIIWPREIAKDALAANALNACDFHADITVNSSPIHESSEYIRITIHEFVMHANYCPA